MSSPSKSNVEGKKQGKVKKAAKIVKNQAKKREEHAQIKEDKWTRWWAEKQPTIEPDKKPVKQLKKAKKVIVME
eukprot:13057102-Heterocapsa_arctica.AAC.1